MDPVIFFSVLIGIYLVAFFFDCFFKSCMHYPWEQFLKNTGLTVKFLRFKWYTTAFNRTVFKWGTAGNKFLTKWFTCGAIVSLAMLPLAFIILFMTIFNGQKGGSGSTGSGEGMASEVKIQILLPGFNLPLEEIGFYVCTFAISTIVHELGHALAAVIEDVPLNGFWFQVYFCIPLALTDISSEHLNSLRWIRKLRILCGGIWHNIVFSGFCYLLFSSFGFVTAPIYATNEAVFVTEVTPESTLRGERGLQANDIITEINDCRVRDIDSWYDCLIQSLRIKPGYCVSSDFIRLNDESVELTHDGIVQCCDAKNYAQCCFEYIDDLSNDGPVEIPQHVCLNIRLTIEDSYGFCSGTCDRGFCLRPLLKNTTTILSIKRRQKPVVIYMGHPGDVSKSIRISPFVPKSGLFKPQLADAFTLFLKYNIVFSLGLALLNALPCFGMDGYHISSTIINSFLVNRIEERAKRETIVLLITGIGTFLFFCAVFKVVWVSLIKTMF